MTTASELADTYHQSIADRDAEALFTTEQAMREFIAAQGYESVGAYSFSGEHILLGTHTGQRLVFANLKDMLEYAESHPDEPTL